MKKLLTLAVATAMTLSVAAASATTLKLSEVHAEGYPTTLADQEFARLIEEKTEGRIKVEVYSGGQLYGEETGAIRSVAAGRHRVRARVRFSGGQLCAGAERDPDAVSV